MYVFILTRKLCNGGSCENTHISAHLSLSSAFVRFKRFLTKKSLKGKDAPNRWTRHNGSEKDVAVFRTGMWGYEVYELRRLLVAETTRATCPEWCKWFRKLPKEY